MEKQAILFGAFLVFSSVCFAAAPVLEVSPTELEFSAFVDEANTTAQSISIFNSGLGPLNWEVIEDCNWLTVEPNSGTSMGEVDDVNVTVDISGLGAGLYNCDLTIEAGGAVNSPQIVSVELNLYTGDVDGDEDVDISDFGILSAAWMTGPNDANWNPDCDISEPNDDFIDILDLGAQSDYWLTGAVADGTIEPNGGDEVQITCAPLDDWDGEVIVSYSSTEPNFVRAFALDITVDSGAVIESAYDFHPDYWVYPGSIDINEAGDVLDSGSPVCDPYLYPGTLGGLDTNGITIEMGALFDSATESPPPFSDVLFRFTVDKSCNVSIGLNAIRGGLAMKDAGSVPTITLTGCSVTKCCPGDSDCDDDMDLTDYYAMQGNLAYIDYFCFPEFCPEGYRIPCDDPTWGFLYNPYMDTDRDCDLDLDDYYYIQGILAYADYLATGGAGTYYYISPTDPVTGVLWPCP